MAGNKNSGRPTKVIIDTDKNHIPPKELKAREDATPVYESQKFIAPNTLSKKEREVWDWLVNIFRETRNCAVSDCDVHLMEMYCRDKVEYEEACERYDGNYYKNIDTETFDRYGEPKFALKVNPDYQIKKEKAASMLKWFDQLGLTPLARARVGLKGANAKKEEDIFAEIMDRTDE